MRLDKSWKWLLATAGAILVGAVGSGLWQNILGPIVHIIGFWLLDVISLAFRHFKDGVYFEIARETPEAASLAMLGLVDTLLMGVLGAVLGFAFSEFRLARSDRRAYTQSAEVNESPALSENDFDADPSRLAGKFRRAQVFFYGWLVLTVCMGTVMAIQTQRLSYIRSAQTFYHQSIRTLLPKLTEQERFEFESRFAQVRNRNDYVALITDLRTVAVKYQFRLPEFSVW